MSASSLAVREGDLLSTHESLLKKIDDFSPTEGWLTQQSANVHVVGGDLRLDVDKNGFILVGELVNAAGQSLHVRWRPREKGWHATIFEPSTGDDYLTDTVEFISSQGDDETLVYRRFWRLGESNRLEIHALVFSGYSNASRGAQS
ncbi:MAG: hypothetical protein AB8G17_12925 [Gammaproteobacteria bacterium]